MSETESKARPAVIELRNPADGKVVGEVPNETAEAVADKVRELRLFQPSWEAIGPKGRKTWLLRFQDWILDNAEHITDVLQSETGKTRAEASIEPPACADLPRKTTLAVSNALSRTLPAPAKGAECQASAASRSA